MTKTALDYAEYAKLDLSKEIQPIHNTIDEMLTRLEEFESVMKMVESDSQDFSSNTFSTILECRQEIETLSKKINHLEIFVNKVDEDVNLVEKQVETAEAYIGVPDNKIKHYLKPLFGKINKDATVKTHEPKFHNLTYRVPKTFRTCDYFPRSESSYERNKKI